MWLALNVQENLPRQDASKSYTHIAFTIDAADIPAMEQRLEQLVIPCLPARPRSVGEGLSLYFADPDGYLLEVHTGDLTMRLNAYENFPRAQE